MGTHPIFESDFDCLTDCSLAPPRKMKLFNYLAAVLLPSAYSRSAGRFPAGPIDAGLFYDQYLQAVIKILEKDEKLQLKMEEAEIEDPGHTHLKLGALQDFEEIHEIPEHLKDE